MISPLLGHLVQRSFGISFFLTVTVEYCGLLNIGITLDKLIEEYGKVQNQSRFGYTLKRSTRQVAGTFKFKKCLQD